VEHAHTESAPALWPVASSESHQFTRILKSDARQSIARDEHVATGRGCKHREPRAPALHRRSIMMIAPIAWVWSSSALRSSLHWCFFAVVSAKPRC